MSLASICQQDVVTIGSDATLQQAARLMRDQHVGSIVVTREDDNEVLHVTGIVTDRDLAIHALAIGLDAERVTVGRLLTGPVISIASDAQPQEAIELMQAAGVRRLPVRDATGVLVGIVSFDDLLRSVAVQMAGLARVLAKGAERELHPPQPAVEPHAPTRGTVLRVPAMGTAGWSLDTGGVSAPG